MVSSGLLRHTHKPQNVPSAASRGGQGGAQFPERPVTTGAPKSPNSATGTFFNTEHLLSKDLSFEQVSGKLASCPGPHLTSLCPCVPYPICANRSRKSNTSAEAVKPDPRCSWQDHSRRVGDDVGDEITGLVVFFNHAAFHR